MYHWLVQLQMEKKMSDSSQICDYRVLLIIITNQSTNIEYYRVQVFHNFSRQIALIQYPGQPKQPLPLHNKL